MPFSIQDFLQDMNTPLTYADFSEQDLLKMVSDSQQTGESDFVTDLTANYLKHGVTAYFVECLRYHAVAPVRNPTMKSLVDDAIAAVETGESVYLIMTLGEGMSALVGMLPNNKPGVQVIDLAYYPKAYNSSSAAALNLIYRKANAKLSERIALNMFWIHHALEGQCVHMEEVHRALSIEEATALVTRLSQHTAEIQKATALLVNTVVEQLEQIASSDDMQEIEEALRLTSSFATPFSSFIDRQPGGKNVIVEAISKLPEVIGRLEDRYQNGKKTQHART